MAKTAYREGDVFAVPLSDGGYAIGLVARAKNGIYLGYFFDEVHTVLPEVNKLVLHRDNAVEVISGGDQAMVEGRWPLLGRLPGWKREEWPMPWFVNWAPPEQAHRVLSSYYPDDPTKSFGLPEPRVSSQDAERLPLNAGSPWPGREKSLNKLLHHTPRPLPRVRIVPGPAAPPPPKPRPKADPVPEEAVRLYLSLPEGTLPATVEERLEAFEEALDEMLQMKNLGYVDGNETGEGEHVIYLYGPDRHLIWTEVQRMLKYSPLPAASVYLREADLDAEPTIIEL